MRVGDAEFVILFEALKVNNTVRELNLFSILYEKKIKEKQSREYCLYLER